MESFLILDADSALGERLSHYFGAQGFSIDIAPDSVSALQRLGQRIFDVVIFDVDDMDFPPEDLLRLIRENNGNAVVIAMSERSKFDEAIRAIREGASDFILKPINLAELEIKVDKGIELKRLNQEGQILRGERALIYRTKNFIGEAPGFGRLLLLSKKSPKAARASSSPGKPGPARSSLREQFITTA